MSRCLQGGCSVKAATAPPWEIHSNRNGSHLLNNGLVRRPLADRLGEYRIGTTLDNQYPTVGVLCSRKEYSQKAREASPSSGWGTREFAALPLPDEPVDERVLTHLKLPSELIIQSLPSSRRSNDW